MSDDSSSLSLHLNSSALEPLIKQVVTEAIVQLETVRPTLPERLAFSEPEAARLIGLEPHQLRDERRRGRITASQIVGRRIRYQRSDLIGYLAARKWER
jgi:hypothetical protein